MSTQFPQPRQSREETCMRKESPANSLPLASTVAKVAGAFFFSSSSRRTGRMAAWGQTIAHWLHWMHLSLSHSGILTATPRFSYADVPEGKLPSSLPKNALTGSLSPSWRLITSQTFLMKSGLSLSLLQPQQLSSAFSQLAGTSILIRAPIPASTAL